LIASHSLGNVDWSVNDISSIDKDTIAVLVNDKANQYRLLIVQMDENNYGIMWYACVSVVMGGRTVAGAGTESRLSQVYSKEFVLVGSAGNVHCLVCDD
jgi:hypothetical protein